MLGWFNEKPVKKLLSIPAARRIELIISVGFPADEAAPEKKRKAQKKHLTPLPGKRPKKN